MLKDAQAGLFDVIVCWKSDRLSRGLYPATALMEAIEGTNITIEAVKDTIDLKTFGIMAAVGKIELENIRERMQMGYRGMVSHGRITGAPRFGYAIEDGLPVVVEQEAETVKRIFQDYLEGRACQPIADNLNLEGIPTKRGGAWTGARVWSILTSPTYAGEGQHCKTRYTKRDDGEREVRHINHMPEERWITVPYPRIIGDYTWQKAKEARQHPQRQVWNRQRKYNVVYLLESILWCDHCGKRYRPDAYYQTHRYVTKDGVEHQSKSEALRVRYMCNGGTKAGCPRPTLQAGAIEKLVWDAVTEFISRPEQVQALLEARQHDLESGATLENVVKGRERLSQVDAERGRTLLQHQRGYINDGELDVRMKGINERMEYFQNELVKLETEAARATEALEAVQGWLDATSHIAARLETLTDVEKAEVVKLLVDRVGVNGKEIQIRMLLEPSGNAAYSPPPRSE